MLSGIRLPFKLLNQKLNDFVLYVIHIVQRANDFDSLNIGQIDFVSQYASTRKLF